MADQFQSFKEEFERLGSPYKLSKIIGSGGNGVVL